MSTQELLVKNFGKKDPKRHLEEAVDALLNDNIVENLGLMLDVDILK
ncbi:unnamed protein product [Soboliphyme baturini]|uniref:Transposase n=1 Tax=Soboliphyme baturini TaxID=241478 RepID=A0A183J318_9BILA|nr:unnamed protein product [Soboliphyme baturini]